MIQMARVLILLWSSGAFLLDPSWAFVSFRPNPHQHLHPQEERRRTRTITTSSSSWFEPVTVSSNQRILRVTTRCWSSDPTLIVYEFSDDDNDDDEEEDDDDEEDEEEEDPYTNVALSEFIDDPNPSSDTTDTSSMVPTTLSEGASELSSTNVDWGGALGRLRERVSDVESGDSQNPSKVLFRLMSSSSPNQAIGSFISKANPDVVTAMSGAVNSLLGGLSNPQSGVEMIVKASGDKLGSLCFQLQMTGYMFRNAEYVLKLKEIMDITGSATLQDYKDAFDRLDRDGSGYIESSEVQELLDDVYQGIAPSFEIETFVKFFDQDNDGRVSWEEFKRGLGAAMVQQAEQKSKLQKLLSSSSESVAQDQTNSDDDDDSEDEPPEIEANVSGTIEIEMEDGSTVEVDAADYIRSLKAQARILKEELRREKLGGDREAVSGQVSEFLAGGGGSGGDSDSSFGGIAEYISRRQGDIKSLTEGISPEIVDTMKMLVDFVLEGGASGKGRKMPKKEEMSMEIPASALQQLALWQLILGYQLREAEAKGDYLKLLE